jgi:hypothetical protein
MHRRARHGCRTKTRVRQMALVALGELATEDDHAASQ